MENRKIIAVGFVGPIKSGKSFAAHQLENLLGLKYLSLSDEIRYVLKENGLDPNDRENLQNMGDELRRTQGSGILAEMVVKRITEGSIYLVAIDSIRNPEEIKVLREMIPGIIILGVDASQMIRYLRYKESGNKISWKEFQRIDNREIKGEHRKSHELQVDKCLKMVDKLVVNETNNRDLLIEELGCAFDGIASEKENKGKER